MIEKVIAKVIARNTFRGFWERDPESHIRKWAEGVPNIKEALLREYEEYILQEDPERCPLERFLDLVYWDWGGGEDIIGIPKDILDSFDLMRYMDEKHGQSWGREKEKDFPGIYWAHDHWRICGQ